MDCVCSGQEYQQTSRKASNRIVLRTSKMISREQILISIQQHGVAPSVAGSRDHEQFLIECNRFLAFDRSLGRDVTGVSAMNHAVAAEMLVELFMIGDIVSVGEKHGRDAAQFFQTCTRLSCKPR